MSRYKRIPITAAMDISEKYEKNQVIIVTWDAVHHLQGVASYGKTKEECDQAARGAQLVQEALNWPPADIVKVKPSKRDLLDTLREAYTQLIEHDNGYHHITPKELLEKIRGLVDDDKQDKEQEKQP